MVIEYLHREESVSADQFADKRRLNKTAGYELTILVPVYNEEENIYALEQELTRFVGQSAMSACVLFVNDGSVDKSLERIVEVCNRQPDFYQLSLEKNSGLSGALKAGIDSSWSRYVAYIDADLQTSPEDLNLLIPFVEDYEMVTGIRIHREDSLVKRTSSIVANGFRRFMNGDNITDTGCPLKIMKTEFAKRIPLFTGMHRFLPALIMLQNGKVKQVPVRHFPRTAGQSKYNLGNRLVAPFFDCFAFRWMKSRYLHFNITETNLE